MKNRHRAASQTYFCFTLVYFILKLLFFNPERVKKILLCDQIIKPSILFILAIVCKAMIFGLKHHLQSNLSSITHRNILSIPTSPGMSIYKAEKGDNT